MAARKRSAIKPGGMPEAWRERIQTSMLINRLQNHVKGDVELSTTQVTAALGLLKKTAPDLQTMAHGQAPELGPVQTETITRPQLTRDQWLALHNAK